jgi:phosphoribosyl 1,2-cyclic phosphate phosphodiesterase
MIEHEGVRIIVDAGPDLRYQLLREEVRHVDAILLTHEHKDHTGGIDDVRALNHATRRAIDIYATERVQAVIRKDFDYAFSEVRYPGAPMIDLHTIDNQPFTVAGVEVVPIFGMHAKLPVTGFRVGGIAYLTDFNYIAPKELLKLKGAEILIINALRRTQHMSHFSLDEALEIGKAVGARHTYLTHISHEMGRHAQVARELPDNVHLAYDGLTVETEKQL